MNNKFLDVVQQENKELDELDNSETREDMKKIKLDSLEYKYRYKIYFTLNNIDGTK